MPPKRFWGRHRRSFGGWRKTVLLPLHLPISYAKQLLALRVAFRMIYSHIRGAILLGIESASLSEDEDDISVY